MMKPIPKSITLRLTTDEAAALAICRSQFERAYEQRFPVKTVLSKLLKEHAKEHVSLACQLQVSSQLVSISAKEHAERLCLIVTPDLVDVFKTLRVRKDGKELGYGEADIVRTLILKKSKQIKAAGLGKT